MISKQKTNLFLKLSIALIILGILFKLLQLQFTLVLMLLGTIGVSIFYSIQFFKKKPKKLLDYSKLILLIAFLLHYIFGVFHWSYGYVFTFIFRCAFVLVVVSYILEVLASKDNTANNGYFPNHSSRTNNLKHLLYILSGITIITGTLFKILHWQFGFINGTTLLVIGLLCAILSLFLPSRD